MEENSTGPKFSIGLIDREVTQWLKKRHEQRRLFFSALEDLCQAPYPEDAPDHITHLRDRFHCLFRFKRRGQRGFRIIYEIDPGEGKLNIVKIDSRDQAYKR